MSYLQTCFARFPEKFPDLKLQLLCASEGTSVQEEWSGSATLLFGAEARRIKMKKEKKKMMMMITVIIAILIILVVSCSHNMSLWKAPKTTTALESPPILELPCSAPNILVEISQ